MMTEKAAALYKEYMAHWNDAGFDRKSFIRRLRSLSKKINRDEEHHYTVLYCDVLATRIGIELEYKV